MTKFRATLSILRFTGTLERKFTSRSTALLAFVPLWAVGIAGLVTYTCGALLLCGQALYWLRAGEWVPLPAVMLVLDEPSVANNAVLTGSSTTFRELVPIYRDQNLQDWLISPKAWVGLQRMVEGTLRYVSVPVAFIAFGFLLAVGSLYVTIRFDDHSRGS